MGHGASAPFFYLDETGDRPRVPQDNGACPLFHAGNAMNLTTPALLFPAISLLLLAYTNRFLTLAQVVRQLNTSADRGAALVQRQLPGLKRRIMLTKYMQGFGVLSFLLCALSMFALFLEAELPGKLMFGASILALTLSLLLSLVEVLISTDALAVVVKDLEAARDQAPFR
jgi:hypothetical protein